MGGWDYLWSWQASHMLIEYHIQDGIDFFHMDALSSAVAIKVNLGLQLTLMVSSLYRLLSQDVCLGYEMAKSRHSFRDLINTSAQIRLKKTWSRSNCLAGLTILCLLPQDSRTKRSRPLGRKIIP